jgi:hypothetical protein
MIVAALVIEVVLFSIALDQQHAEKFDVAEVVRTSELVLPFRGEKVVAPPGKQQCVLLYHLKGLSIAKFRFIRLTHSWS